MNIFTFQTRRRPRGGFTVLEMAAALVVVSAAMVALVEFVGLAARQRRTARHRLAAVMEVANQAERVALLAWNDVEPKTFLTWQPTSLFAAELPKAECRAIVTDEPGAPAARRVELSVTWPNAVEGFESVSLTVWKYGEETGR
jgi:Tfp pilus assembly protein PilV